MSIENRLLFILLAVSVSNQRVLAQNGSVQSSKQATLSGIVADDRNAPIQNAELTLARIGERVRLVRTGEDGRFSFGNVGTGRISIAARRIGYVPRTLHLDVKTDSTPVRLVLTLQTLAQNIAPVRVEARDSRLESFYDHRSHSAFGRFIDAAEITRRGPLYLSELFRTVPGASVKGSNRPGNIVRLRGCQPMIWLDGMRVPHAELDDITNPVDIGGIEIYSTWSALPGEYMDREMGACGAIVLWTKSH